MFIGAVSGTFRDSSAIMNLASVCGRISDGAIGGTDGASLMSSGAASCFEACRGHMPPKEEAEAEGVCISNDVAGGAAGLCSVSSFLMRYPIIRLQQHAETKKNSKKPTDVKMPFNSGSLVRTCNEEAWATFSCTAAALWSCGCTAVKLRSSNTAFAFRRSGTAVDLWSCGGTAVVFESSGAAVEFCSCSANCKRDTSRYLGASSLSDPTPVASCNVSNSADNDWKVQDMKKT
mmetsp:Transcript_790/g.1579  ORF Transcript_790/g.1579 Transcript_790/m.1579 type:complete len:233 (+) Transcript_790:639-1337(+)